MAAGNMYDVLRNQGISKHSLDHVIGYLALKQRQYERLHAKEPDNTAPHRFNIYHYYKNFRLLNRLRGNALSLFKTQYAKKPKNPV